jgi:putative transposase
MSRLLRLEYPGAVYHLTSRGNARQGIFWVDADREWFFRTLAQVVSRYGWICHAYCLMENHYHLGRGAARQFIVRDATAKRCLHSGF